MIRAFKTSRQNTAGMFFCLRLRLMLPAESNFFNQDEKMQVRCPKQSKYRESMQENAQENS